jgi:hypothetical protein
MLKNKIYQNIYNLVYRNITLARLLQHWIHLQVGDIKKCTLKNPLPVSITWMPLADNELLLEEMTESKVEHKSDLWWLKGIYGGLGPSMSWVLFLPLSPLGQTISHSFCALSLSGRINTRPRPARSVLTSLTQNELPLSKTERGEK